MAEEVSEKRDYSSMQDHVLADTMTWWGQRLRKPQFRGVEETLRTLMDPTRMPLEDERNPNSEIVGDALRETYSRIISAAIDRFGVEIITVAESDG